MSGASPAAVNSTSGLTRWARDVIQFEQYRILMTTRPRSRLLNICVAIAALAAACATESRRAPEKQTTISGKPPVAVTVVTAEAAELTDAIPVVGSLEPKFAADVKSEVTGVVTAVYVTDWVRVKKGDPLAQLDTSEIDATIQAMKAVEAQASVVDVRAQREYARALQLKEYGLITSQALDETRTELEAAKAAVGAARAQIHTADARRSKSFIRAPMDGVVAVRHVSVGDRVENVGSSDPMFRLVDNRQLDLTVTVPSARLSAVRTGQPLVFVTDAVPGRTFEGRVMFINPSVDEANRSARIVASVQNLDAALKGGLFVRGRIVVSSREHVLQVPREALLDWDVERQTAQLFVVSGDRAEKRAVKTGIGTEDAVEIPSGLAEGEKVVTRGAFALRSGERVSVSTG